MTGHPVASARVGNEGRSVMTDTRGTFNLDNVGKNAIVLAGIVVAQPTQ